jgi:cytochrome bd-type quinol oxidase subunit 2
VRTALAAKVFLALTCLVVAFQLALAAGAPWGELTMGGAVRGQMPPRMRAIALGSAVLLTGFGAIVAARAHLAFPRWRRTSRWLVWVVAAYSIVGVVLNALTPSPRERALWLPVAVVLAVCAVIVALGSRERA